MMKKNKISLIIMMMVAFAFILSSCTATVTDNVEKDNNEVMEDKEMAYDFELLDLEGNTHKLSDYSGKKVYLKFWGTWCPVCVSSSSFFQW
jgi:thiol-disulfide isomerase/thioredoxin